MCWHSICSVDVALESFSLLQICAAHAKERVAFAPACKLGVDRNATIDTKYSHWLSHSFGVHLKE